MDSCPLLPELWSVYILPQCDLVSCCLLYETCKWFAPVVNAVLRPRFAPSREDAIPELIHVKMIEKFNAPEYVAISPELRREYATVFMREHLSGPLLDWLGKAQFELVMRAPEATYYYRQHPLTHRFATLPVNEAMDLCHALHAIEAYSVHLLVRFLISTGNPTLFSSSCPFTKAGLGHHHLHVAFESGSAEMVDYIASTYDLSYHDNLPSIAITAAACTGSDELYEAFRHLLPARVRKLAHVDQFGEIPFDALPSGITLAHWDRLFSHLTVPKTTKWSRLLYYVMGDEDPAFTLSLYRWIRMRYPDKVLRVGRYLAVRTAAAQALYAAMRADGFEVPEPAQDEVEDDSGSVSY
jgi:hypothetical protein